MAIRPLVRPLEEAERVYFFTGRWNEEKFNELAKALTAAGYVAEPSGPASLQDDAEITPFGLHIKTSSGKYIGFMGNKVKVDTFYQEGRELARFLENLLEEK